MLVLQEFLFVDKGSVVEVFTDLKLEIQKVIEQISANVGAKGRKKEI